MSASHLKILITGGAGFIGSHLVDALVELDHRVTVLDNFSTGNREYVVARDNLSVVEGDVRDADVVNKAATGVDVIIHLAAIASVQKSIEDPVKTHAVNFGGTLNVLEAARLQKVKRVLFASSAAVYGDTPELPAIENGFLNPLTPYAIDKLSSERYLDFYQRLYGIETAAFRFFNIFGERQDPASPYSGVISIFASRALQDNPLVIYGDGEQTRDFIYVKDVISILVQATTQNNICFDAVNIGNGKSISLNELVKIIESILQKTITVDFKSSRDGDIRHSLASIDCLMKHYKKEETSMPDGLARLIASLVAN